MNGEIPGALVHYEKAFTSELVKARKDHPRLELVSRTKIIQQMGYNPLQKANHLLLPYGLTKYV